MLVDVIRVGKIHTINYASGTASVVYNDRNNQPSPQFPFISFAYDMPKVDDTVVVLLLPNSTSKGFILGVPWSVKTKTMDISAPNIKLKSVVADSVTVNKEIIAKSIETKTLKAENLAVETAEIVNLNVTGAASGNFPVNEEDA